MRTDFYRLWDASVMGLGMVTTVVVIGNGTSIVALGVGPTSEWTTGSIYILGLITELTTGSTSGAIVVRVDIGIVNVDADFVTTTAGVLGSIKGTTKMDTYYFLGSTKVTWPLPFSDLLVGGGTTTGGWGWGMAEVHWSLELPKCLQVKIISFLYPQQVDNSR